MGVRVLGLYPVSKLVSGDLTTWSEPFLIVSSVERLANQNALRSVPYVRRWNHGRQDLPDDYPYRSHGQPITAYASLIACLLILSVANGASLWKQFRVQQFLAAYLAVSNV
jgi:amino acid permease